VLVSATTASAWAGSNDHAVGWVHDRLVLLIPAHTVMLVPFAAEHLNDLSSARCLAVHATGFDAVTWAGVGFSRFSRHALPPLTASNRLAPTCSSVSV
jgi:hypothetical protein